LHQSLEARFSHVNILILILILTTVIARYEQFACWASISKSLDDCSSLNELFTHLKHIYHEAATECLHSEHFCVLDMAKFINLAGAL